MSANNEDLKKVTPPDQWADLPARYALVEIETVAQL